MRRLVICCDGTWNDPTDGTNVWKLRESLARTDLQPEPYYDRGVDGLLGGIFGEGISRNIRQAYRWLCENYREGDELCLFGFSRGAFSVRSLVGFVRVAGLLPANQAAFIDDGYEVYRAAQGADAEVAKRFRQIHSSRHIEDLRITILGVWDTVGALGVPVTGLRSFLGSRWKFHDYDLSSYVERAHQALAIDEHRTPFLAALWTVPRETDPARRARRERQVVEQVWFAGGHSDVGGRAGAHAFAWMVERARAAGLEFDDARVATHLPAADAPPSIHDAVTFPYGVAGSALRPVLNPRFPGQSIHPSVELLAGYEPDNLRVARAGAPLVRPAGERLQYTIPFVQDYYLRQYDERPS